MMPDAVTSRKQKSASAEKRLRVAAVMSRRGVPEAGRASRPEMRARTAMPPTQSEAPSTCRPIEFTAPAWSLELAAWPLSAGGTMPRSARSSVNASAVVLRRPKLAVATSAATITTKSQPRPSGKSLMKKTRALVYSVSPLSACPDTFA